MNVEEDKRGLQGAAACSRGRPPSAPASASGDLILAVNGRSIAGVNSDVATSRIKGPAGTTRRVDGLHAGRGQHRTVKVEARADRGPGGDAAGSSSATGRSSASSSCSASAPGAHGCSAAQIDKLLEQGAEGDRARPARQRRRAAAPRPCSCRACSSRTARSSRCAGRSRAERTHDAEGDAIDEDIPVVVLVDGGSASASEIVDRRAARPRARDGGRHAHVRQGPRPGGRAAVERRRARPDRRRTTTCRAARRSRTQGHQAAGPGRGRPGHRSRRGAARGARRRSLASCDERGGPGPARAPAGPADGGGAREARALPRGRAAVRAAGRGPPWSAGGAGAGDLVLVGGGKRGARVLRRLGRPDRARDVVEGLMLDRGLHRTYPRAASAEAEAPLDEPYAADARVDLRDLPTFTIDPDDAQDFDDAISARREDGRVRRLGAHRRRDRLPAARRPARARGVPARHERVRAGRGRADAARGAVEPAPARCGPGEDKLAVTVEMEMDGRGRDERGVPPLARAQRQAAHLRRGGRAVRRARARRGAVGRAARRRARGGAARCASGATRSSSARCEPAFEFDADGHVTGVRYEAQTESHRLIEKLMILANEQVAGYLADRKLPTLYRVHERPEPAVGRRSWPSSSRASTSRRRRCPKQMTPQQAADAVAEISRIVARESRGRRAVRRAGAARAQAGVLHAAQPRPRRARRARATATSPRRSGATRTWWPTARCSRGSASTTRPRPAHELEEAGVLSSASEREAMKIERDADDVCLAFLLERVLSETPTRTSRPAFEGEVVGLIEKGAFVAVRRGALRGLAAGAPAARLVDAQRARHRARGRGLGAPAAARRRGRGRGRPGRRARAAAWISTPRRVILVGRWRRRRSARRPRATSPRTGRRASATTCSRSSRPGSCSRARR